MTTIELVGIEFYAYHGVPDAEQSVGHRYRLDLTLGLLESSTYRTDSLEGLVDYAKVAEEAVGVATASQFRTLEFLSEQIGQHLMASFPIHELSVRIAKIAPPMPFIVEEVAVTREFAL